MIFRQLYDAVSSTYTYLLADEATREAVLVDPVYERHQRDLALVRELDVKLVAALDTHCHADHVTGVWLMKQATGAAIVAGAATGISPLDRALRDGDVVRFGGEELEARATPGHTSGCLTYVSSARRMAFTGDTLLIRGCGRTDFQQGDAHAMWRSIRERIFTLPENFFLYPAHDYEGRTVSTVAEEKRFNPRIGGEAREEDFVGYMENLGLPHPKQIAVAVPANLRAGMPDDGRYPAPATWGPVTPSYGGIFEIDAEWVARHRDEVHIVDVRSPSELEGELGRLHDAQAIPLDELRARAEEVPRDKPVVTICQSGKRSALATLLLRKAGVTDVANVAGGLIRWRQLGFPS
ncbi:MAG: MBL fold metallo-hydrolase [Deltaproteobacteria bacterium]|nr:MBL fold metallo-hydrolase [Deltaproteobacteria bacterium]